MHVRAARAGDGPSIARAHVRSWKAGYRGLVCPRFLASLDEVASGRAWEHRIVSGPPPSVAPFDHDLLVVERADADTDTGADPASRRRAVDPEVVGVATVGPDRQRPTGDTGELWMLSVHPDAWGTGAAGRLLDGAETLLVDRGYDDAVLWVLAGNRRARRFYERLGWRRDGCTRREEIGGRVVPELRYRRTGLTSRSR